MCSINDIPGSMILNNTLKDLHFCKNSSKVQSQDEFLVFALQYFHNGFALLILGQIYARLQEINYYQLLKNTNF